MGAAQEGVITSLCGLILNILLWNMCTIYGIAIKKKKGLNKERRRKSKASRVPAASDTLSGGGDKCGESLDCTYPWAPAVQELGRSGGLSQEVYLPPCGESY